MKASRSSPLATLAPNLSLSFTVPYVSCFLRSYIIVILYPDMEITLKTRFTLILWTCPVDLNYVTPFMTNISYIISLFYLCISIGPSIYPLSIHMIASLSSFNPPRPDIVPSIRIEHMRVDAWHWWIQCQNVRKKKCVWNDIPNARNLWKVQVKSSKLISFPTRPRVGPEDFQHLWISWPLRFASKSHALDTSGHCWDSKEVAGDVWMAIQTWADLNDLRWLQIHQITTTSKVNRRRIN